MPRPIALAKHIRHVDDGNHPAARENQNMRIDRVAKKKPKLAANEVALELSIEGAPQQVDLSPSMVSTIRDLIQSSIGLGVEIAVVEQPRTTS